MNSEKAKTVIASIEKFLWQYDQQAMVLLFALIALAFGVTAFISYKHGLGENRRRMRRLVRRNPQGDAEKFVMQQAEDGAMEIRLSKRAYKKLKQDPIEGAIIGKENQMVLRILVL